MRERGDVYGKGKEEKDTCRYAKTDIPTDCEETI